MEGEEVLAAAHEWALHGVVRNVVSARSDALSYSRQREFDGRQPEEDDVDRIARPPQPCQTSRQPVARQRCLEREALTRGLERVQPRQHDPPRLDGDVFRTEG